MLGEPMHQMLVCHLLQLGVPRVAQALVEEVSELEVGWSGGGGRWALKVLCLCLSCRSACGGMGGLVHAVGVDKGVPAVMTNGVRAARASGTAPLGLPVL